MMRAPAVADRFYPGNPEQLQAALDALVPVVAEQEKQKAFAAIMPHAGYVYSGATAGLTIARVQVPETVLIIGPNHHGRGPALALSGEDWRMPLGSAPIDRALATSILQHSTVFVEDQEAHLYEHSIEVQIPFLQQVQKQLRIVPVVAAHLSYDLCRLAGHELAVAIDKHPQPVLMVASSDMSHYETRQRASKKDSLAIERILALDPQGLYDTVHGKRISMCGVVPAVVVLLAALELGAAHAELAHYTDSGEASGDTSQVVGYAGLIIS